MSLTKVAAFVSAAVAAVQVLQAAEYDYDEDTAWPDLGQCNGTMQSPIDIIPANVHASIDESKGVERLYPVLFDGGAAREYFMKNNGHGAYVRATDNSTTAATVMGGITPEGTTFNFHSFHFHWGETDDEGSEHQVNGMMYPLEAHFIFYDSDAETLANAIQLSTDAYDGTPSAAANGGYRIAVFGYFFEISDSDNAFFAPIIDAMESIEYDGEKTTANATLSLTLSDFLTDDSFTDFYSYLGSLTTPNCNELIRWHVTKQTMGISSAQMARIRGALYDSANATLDRNWREPQTNTNPLYSMCTEDSLTADDDPCTADYRADDAVSATVAVSMAFTAVFAVIAQ